MEVTKSQEKLKKDLKIVKFASVSIKTPKLNNLEKIGKKIDTGKKMGTLEDYFVKIREKGEHKGASGGLERLGGRKKASEDCEGASNAICWTDRGGGGRMKDQLEPQGRLG